MYTSHVYIDIQDKYLYVHALRVQRLLVELLFPKTIVLGRFDFINISRKNIILIVFDMHVKMLHVYMAPCIHIYEYIQGERDRALDPSYPGLFFVLI